MKPEIADKNLFMMCEKPNRAAFSELPQGFFFRTCRLDELGLWKRIHFDISEDADAYDTFMTAYFENVYANKGPLFYERCLFVCNSASMPVATGFLWNAYGFVNTLHWLKVKQEYENRGIGRALLTKLLSETSDFPIFLHTQPGSYRAIKLYSDFGFALLSNLEIGFRNNELAECLHALKECMPDKAYGSLRVTTAPAWFLTATKSSPISQF